MTTVCDSHELAISQLQQLCSIEKQSLMYLKVLAHKVENPRLRDTILGLIPTTHQKLEQLELLLRMMKSPPETANTSGINGIISEGLQRLETVETPGLKDAIILRTIILLAHYKQGSYRILLHYFKLLEREKEANVTRSILYQEGDALFTLMHHLELEMPALNSNLLSHTSLPMMTEYYQPN